MLKTQDLDSFRNVEVNECGIQKLQIRRHAEPHSQTYTWVLWPSAYKLFDIIKSIWSLKGVQYIYSYIYIVIVIYYIYKYSIESLSHLEMEAFGDV